MTMAVPDGRPLKRPRRNRVTADLHDFRNFPTGEEAVFTGKPFRLNVLEFLSRHARVAFPTALFPSLMTWQILFGLCDLVDGPDLSTDVVALDVVEEDVTRSTRSVYCDQCRVVGWSGHPVCRKRYHFIVRAQTTGVEGYQKACSRCGNLLHLCESSQMINDTFRNCTEGRKLVRTCYLGETDLICFERARRCKWCSSVITADDLEDWVYSQFDDNTHLLHGVIHLNGYGHLLTVNGREGGSKILSGCDIMNFWDRLCRTLAVRKVTVMDVSKKYQMEYRLLHAVTRGHSWYGEWGYEFGSGSYALTQESYEIAVHTLSSMPLIPLMFQGRRPRSRLQAIIAFYQSLSESELLTLKDIFSLLLSLIREAPNTSSKKFQSSAPKVLCAWTRNDVEHVHQAMIKVLLAANGGVNWVSRRALKGVMSKAASLELIDYCLKYFGGKLAANGMAVEVRCNPDSNDTEFRLTSQNILNYGVLLDSSHPPVDQIKTDLKFLYDSLLHPETMVSYKPQKTREILIDSATKLLDCKQFMKDYNPNTNSSSAIHLWCHVELSDQPNDDLVLPPELVVLPLNASVADLKCEATKTFQEVYAMFKRFQAEELPEYGSIEDSMTLKLLIGLGGKVQIQGRCPAKQGLYRFRMERGMENWTVDCVCGAKDDDGERMLACDTCGVWQHTRCAGIDNSHDIPAKYVCTGCMSSYPTKSVNSTESEAAKSEEETKPVNVSGVLCRSEVHHTPGVETKLTMDVR